MNPSKTHSRIPWAQPFLDQEEEKAVVAAVASSWISGGDYVSRFEQEMAQALNTSEMITTSNGTVALQLAFIAMGIGPGDEVIVPGYGFAAAANVVISLGAKPRFADVDPHTWCLSPDSVRSLLSEQTKSVVAIHPYGNLCAMDALMELCKRNGIGLIEDAAEALFSRYQGSYAGTLGDLGTFSFQAAKTLTTGEGGMVCLKDPRKSDRLRIWRDHGRSRDQYYWHQVPGVNGRLSNILASLGCAQLQKKETIIRRRKEIYARYAQYLSDIEEIEMQKITVDVDPVIWTMGISIFKDWGIRERDQIMDEMRRRGVETRPGFASFREMPPYDAPCLAVSERLSSGVVCLPVFVGLKDDDVKYICETLKTAIQRVT